ncbi:DUF2939 domain-containing protein [Paraburkholderia caribensis]|jgi:hypothetical protein|uniref:DUF2939 domain-containing protein n=1 Tax=Paraburkholderia TaxID=1822464 RepID=UPI001CAAF9DA|nr:DUF2939 domain-containing protein [Paraburkholderia caribensis]BEU21733.1 DUF2939 domain-containing protein [Paraburkholderia sp. 22B1P]GJH31468.1 DUF2939 domain-containing protein [Paraburkholderia hospita]CAG9256379.1 conserved hypothetical protein [Paraburkholderia caribensis]
MAGLVKMKGRVGRPLLIALIVIVVVAALGYAYASPYIALDRLKRAADSRDVDTVNAYVDYPALRDSLKLQVTGLLTRRLDVQHNGNPLAAIGAMIGVALIGPLVDAYATPDGVAALLNGIPPRGEPGERPPPPPAAPADNPAPNSPQTPAPASSQANANGNTPPQPPQTTAGYRGVNEFVVTYQHGVGDTRYAAIFRRQGLFTWKLSAVDLNG